MLSKNNTTRTGGTLHRLWRADNKTKPRFLWNRGWLFSGVQILRLLHFDVAGSGDLLDFLEFRQGDVEYAADHLGFDFV